MPIIQSISRFLQTIQIPFTTASNISRQRRFIKQNVIPQLTAAIKTADGSLDENDLKKITGYYGLAVPAILGEAFCALRNEAMTDKERMASTSQGAMTGLGDDFFDKQRLSEQGVKDFIEMPEKFSGNSASEKLFLSFYKTALANAPAPGLMKDQLYKVFHAQLLSKQQDRPGLSQEVIKDITIRKGAESLLYYRTAFEHPIQKAEEKMLYSLGGLMQLSNDIFDVYNDHQSGVNTMITTATKIKDLRLQYTALLQIGKDAAFKSGYSKKNVRKFLGMLYIGIFSRCYVCLDQMQKIEKRTAGIFDLTKYSRRDLICDMDTFMNKMSSLKYHLKLSRINR